MHSAKFTERKCAAHLHHAGRAGPADGGAHHGGGGTQVGCPAGPADSLVSDLSRFSKGQLLLSHRFLLHVPPASSIPPQLIALAPTPQAEHRAGRRQHRGGVQGQNHRAGRPRRGAPLHATAVPGPIAAARCAACSCFAPHGVPTACLLLPGRLLFRAMLPGAFLRQEAHPTNPLPCLSSPPSLCHS